MGSETQLKNRVRKMILKEFPEIWFFKSSDRFTSGIPDIIGCFNGQFFAIELKRDEKSVATPLQLHTISQIKKAKGHAMVCRSVQEVRDCLLIIKSM